LIDAGRASGQYDPFRRQDLDLRGGNGRGLYLAVDMSFPHPPGDELIVLGTKINDHDHLTRLFLFEVKEKMNSKRLSRKHEKKKKHERESKLQRSALRRPFLANKSAGTTPGKNSPKGCLTVFVFCGFRLENITFFRVFVIHFFLYPTYFSPCSQ
jgi:hypothetical protein